MSYAIQIDVGMAITLGAEPFAYLCLLTMIQTANHPERLNFYLGIDLHHLKVKEGKKLFKLQLIRELVPDIKIIWVKTRLPHSSLSHGTVLNEVFNNFTNQYGLICDSDLGFLLPGWDDLFLSKFTQQIKAVGLHTNDQYHLRNFPTIHCVLLDNEIVKKLTVDFRPEGTQTANPPPLIQANEVESFWYRVPVGTKIKLDTGSELARKLIEAGFDGYCFQCVSALLDNSQHAKFLDQYTLLKNIGEYQTSTGQVILTHHRSSTKVLAERGLPKKSKVWMKQIIQYLITEHQIDLSGELDIIFDFFQ